MSFKDQARRRKVAEKRGRRGARRAAAMLLRQGVLHPVVIGDDQLEFVERSMPLDFTACGGTADE